MIDSKRTLTPSSWINPAISPPQQSVDVEWRTDPLTGEVGMLPGLRAVKMEEPDFKTLAAKSLERPCPFCPENIDRAASNFPPEFIPEGRIRIGGCTLFPNIVPYVPDSAVAVFSPKHFERHADFAEADLVNGLKACREYLSRLAGYHPDSKYQFIGMNYLPMACASILHPHIQVYASETPLPRHARLLAGSESYYNDCGRNYWADYVSEEKERGERCIGTVGGTEWFASFVSLGWMMDLTAVFPGRKTLSELADGDLNDFARGLKRVFRYMAGQNYYSYNLALYSGLPDSRSFWCHARLVQRVQYGPLGQSDMSTFQLLMGGYTMLKRPEETAGEIRPYLAAP